MVQPGPPNKSTGSQSIGPRLDLPEDPATDSRLDSVGLDCIEHNQAAFNSLRRAVKLGQGEFSLILAQVNYRHLRQVLIQQLGEELDLNVVLLPPNATNLRKSIAAEMAANAAEQSRWQATREDKALMVIGIEEIETAFLQTDSSGRIADPSSALVKLLRAANLGRDALPKHFPYPVVLWVNDTVLSQMNRYAPDLKSFAATPIRFDYPLSSLLTILSARADETFDRILNDKTVSLWPGRLPLSTVVNEPVAARELRFAIARITQLPLEQEHLVSLDLLIDLLFLQARSQHRRGELEKAKYRYEKSLSHWQRDINRRGENNPIANQSTGKLDSREIEKIDKVAVVLFHLGLWWRCRAIPTAPTNDSTNLGSTRREYTSEACHRNAREHFEAVVDIFKQQNRPDRLGQFILSLAEVLKKLKDWDALSAIAHQAIPLHKNDPIRLAQDYGYLAEALLAQNNNHPTPADIVAAQGFILHALEVSQLNNQPSVESDRYQIAQDRIFVRYQRGGHLYLLARTHQLKGQTAIAIENLEQALQNTSPYYDLTLYRQILDRLWMLYYRHRRYAEAFEVKLEQRRVESLFGLRAFIGAGQIQPTPTIAASPLNVQTNVALSAAIRASGRAEDIASLVDRLSQPRYPIVVIHGQSGVGKSSILRAGLIPRLRSLMQEGRTTLPILIGGYGNWINQIEAALAEEAPTRENTDSTSSNEKSTSASKISSALQQFVRDRYQQIVLIFDQFEDFFYKYPNISERQELYTFLRDCLDFPYVKVVLSIREDFLHYLLEWDRSADLETINNDILSKEIRYYLGNLTPKAAERLIHRLSEPSAFSPEPALVSALVDDLAALTGEVRPIELQVVGAQLQRQKIETLAAYKSLGRSPKKQLLKNFLSNVIYDCGPENRTMANSVLYLLSEGGNRPLKSLSELREPLTLAGIENTPQQLSLVLDIFIGSGLVFEVPEVSGVRYQLVHEYLAGLVQDQQQPGLMEVLRVERDRRALTESQLQKALTAQSETLAEATLARQKVKVAEIEALVSAARSLRLSGNGLDALAKALQAANQVQSQVRSQVPSTDLSLLKMRVTLCLAAALYSIHEKNVLSGHRDWILAVDWSAAASHNSASHTIVSASEDGTLNLWTQQGQLIRTLTGHDAGVIDVCFSQDGRYIASASLDHTIRLWHSNGDFIRRIEFTQASVTSISFDPDATMIAATYSDTTTRLWRLDGELATTLEGHEDWARTVAFSPDGRMLATGSEDKTVRLWSVTGEPLQTLRGHRGWVRSVSFSPDGTLVAAAGDTNGIRLWDINGGKRTFYGHENWVRAVAFSPDGQRLASASDDQTIRIWGLDGQVLQIFKHRSNVHSVAWSADGRSLVSGGDDDQVHIWQLQGPALTVLGGQNRLDEEIVWSARWQPGGKASSQILSTSGNGRVRRWNDSGELLQTVTLPQRGAHSVDWHPDGTRFAIACSDYSIQIRQANGELIQTLSGHGDMVWQVKYSPDGQQLASVSSDYTLRLWNQQGQLLKILTDHTNTVWSVGFSPDGRYLVSASEDNSLRLWHTETGLIQTVEGHTGGVWCAAFSPDQKFVASGGADGVILLWSVSQSLEQSSKQIRLASKPIPLRGHRDWVRSLRFSPNGDFLASSSDDGTVRLWPLFAKVLQTPDSLEELLPPLAGHEGVVWDVDFDPSGERLLSAGADGTVRIWNLDLANLQRQGIDWISDWLISRPQVRQQIGERIANQYG